MPHLVVILCPINIIEHIIKTPDHQTTLRNALFLAVILCPIKIKIYKINTKLYDQ